VDEFRRYFEPVDSYLHIAEDIQRSHHRPINVDPYIEFKLIEIDYPHRQHAQDAKMAVFGWSAWTGCAPGRRTARWIFTRSEPGNDWRACVFRPIVLSVDTSTVDQDGHIDFR
jgi:hypothetical protein